MECGELMPSSLVFHEAAAPIAFIAKSMTQTSVVPLVENTGNMRLVGIVTAQDIVSKALAFSRDLNTTPAYEIMTADPVTCKPTDDIEYALRLMRKCDIDCLPVVSCEKKLLGMIRRADLYVSAAAKLCGTARDTGERTLVGLDGLIAPEQDLAAVCEVDAM
jgi:CBS domain-containing protein